MKLLMTLVVLMITSSSFAETTRTDTSRYIIYKTPYKELMIDEQRVVLEESIGILTKWLGENLPYNEMSLGSIDALEALESSLGVVLDKIDQQVQKSRDKKRGFRAVDLLPTAFSIYFGGGATANLAVGGGGNFSAALIIMPVKVIKIDKITKVVTRYYELLSNWVGIGQLKVGVGIGGGPEFTAGVGFIWGELKSPAHYKGPFLSWESGTSAGLGVHFRAGALHQVKKRGFFQNKFIAAGITVGGVGLQSHAGTSIVVDAQGLLESMGIVDPKSEIATRTEEVVVE